MKKVYIHKATDHTSTHLFSLIHYSYRINLIRDMLLEKGTVVRGVPDGNYGTTVQAFGMYAFKPAVTIANAITN